MCFDVGADFVIVSAGADGHDDFFQRRVAGAFTKSVNCALHLPRSGFNRGKAVGHSQTKVVMTVSTDHGTGDVGNVLLQVRNDAKVVAGSGIADGVRNVHCCRSGGDCLFHDFAEEIEFRADGVFG